MVVNAGGSLLQGLVHVTMNFNLDIKFKTKFSLSEEHNEREMLLQSTPEDVSYTLNSIVDA